MPRDHYRQGLEEERSAEEVPRIYFLVPATEAAAKRKKPGYKARRRVVERTHSWLNRFRKLLVSFEKTEASFVELLTLAAALICWRQTIVIYG